MLLCAVQHSISSAGRIHSSKATAAGLLLCAVQHSIDISCWPHPQQQSYSSGFAAVCRAAFDRYLQLAASTAAKLQQRVCCCVPCSIRSISPTGRIHGSKATAAGVGPC